MNMRQSYCMGWLYSYLKTIGEKAGKEVGFYSFEKACNYPFSAQAQAVGDVHKAGLVTAEVDRIIGSAMEEMDDIGGAETLAPITIQGEWQRGYYHQRAGRPLVYDIAAARKKKGWTQAQLAEAIGADQGQVSRWEKGTVKPSAEYLDKIKAALE